MNIRLLVLGLLGREPMHGYDIQRILEQNQAAGWANVLPGSVYHALKSMADEGLVTTRATEQRGNRQRAIYEVTAAGRKTYLELLRAALARLPRSFPANTYVAISFLDDLPRDEVLTLVDRAIEGLLRERVSWDDGEKAKASAGFLPPVLAAMFQNGRDHLDADLRLLERIRDAARAAGNRPLMAAKARKS